MEEIYPNIFSIEIVPFEDDYCMYIVASNYINGNVLYGEIGDEIKLIYTTNIPKKTIITKFVLIGKDKEFKTVINVDANTENYPSIMDSNKLKSLLIVCRNEIGGFVPIGQVKRLTI